MWLLVQSLFIYLFVCRQWYQLLVSTYEGWILSSLVRRTGERKERQRYVEFFSTFNFLKARNRG